MQALQEEAEEHRAAMALSAGHAAALALRWLEGSANGAATAAFLATHPLLAKFTPAQVKVL